MPTNNFKYWFLAVDFWYGSTELWPFSYDQSQPTFSRFVIFQNNIKVSLLCCCLRHTDILHSVKAQMTQFISTLSYNRNDNSHDIPCHLSKPNNSYTPLQKMYHWDIYLANTVIVMPCSLHTSPMQSQMICKWFRFRRILLEREQSKATAGKRTTSRRREIQVIDSF